MISQEKLLQQDVWEAWVEFDQFSQHFGTLYIWGEVSGPEKRTSRTIQTDYGTQLIIQLPIQQEGSGRTREFLHSEPVLYPSQYHSICVYAGESLIARFNDIDVLV